MRFQALVIYFRLLGTFQHFSRRNIKFSKVYRRFKGTNYKNLEIYSFFKK